MQTVANNNEQGVVLKKDEKNSMNAKETNKLNGVWIIATVLAAFVILLVVLRRKRKQ
jgi:cobaltochelatase CobN